MSIIPKIKLVKPMEDMILLVTFDNDVIKKFDIKSLIPKFPIYNRLKDEALFNSVQVDCGGYGIAWNDEIDISECELWENGELAV